MDTQFKSVTNDCSNGLSAETDQLKSLNEVELALVGGGSGDVVFA